MLNWGLEVASLRDNVAHQWLVFHHVARVDSSRRLDAAAEDLNLSMLIQSAMLIIVLNAAVLNASEWFCSEVKFVVGDGAKLPALVKALKNLKGKLVAVAYWGTASADSIQVCMREGEREAGGAVGQQAVVFATQNPAGLSLRLTCQSPLPSS